MSAGIALLTASTLFGNMTLDVGTYTSLARPNHGAAHDHGRWETPSGEDGKREGAFQPTPQPRRQYRHLCRNHIIGAFDAGSPGQYGRPFDAVQPRVSATPFSIYGPGSNFTAPASSRKCRPMDY